MTLGGGRNDVGEGRIDVMDKGDCHVASRPSTKFITPDIQYLFVGSND